MVLEKKQKIILVGALIFCVVIGFAGGWIIKEKTLLLFSPSNALRLGGFKFISPLLVCNTNSRATGEDFLSLKNKLQEIVNSARADKKIITASIYYRDLKVGEEIEINSNEKFYPASLRKVPLLMALYKATEHNPNYLKETKVSLTGTDQNAQQEIAPKGIAEIGKKYSLEELAEKMILYSDNNAASALTELVGTDSLIDLFAKLQVPLVVFKDDYINVDNRDFITAHDYAIFFRVLYNATYLKAETSDQLVNLLTETDYKNGLVAGVPENIVVAHKFGLLSEKDEVTGAVLGRELHDCGIVYHPKFPYILCVMTKSQGSIQEIESLIKEISQATYQGVDEIKK